MIGNTIWDEETRALLMHIIPQEIYHGDAQIRGSSAALRRLGEALITASTMPQTETVLVMMMAADGECYDITIHPMSDTQIHAGPLPYAQLGLPWDFERCQNCERAQAALAGVQA